MIICTPEIEVIFLPPTTLMLKPCDSKRAIIVHSPEFLIDALYYYLRTYDGFIENFYDDCSLYGNNRSLSWQFESGVYRMSEEDARLLLMEYLCFTSTMSENATDI